MPYSSSTVANVIDRLNRTYFLPAIQRPFVWGPEQLLQLFDSLMKGYPINSFLFWEVAPENKLNWQIYKFAEHFRYGEIHNEIAEPTGRDITLVLDGQQRLTSLLIGLRGSFTVKAKGKRWDNPSAWQRKRLYIDLLLDPELMQTSDEAQEDVEHPFGFELFESAPSSKHGKLWFKVGDILDHEEPKSLCKLKDSLLKLLPSKSTWVQKEIASRNLDRIHTMIWKDEIISYYTELKQDYDRVLGIFVRANDAGTKLSKSDLMLSMVSSKWTDISAREEIYNFVDTINGRLDRKNDVNKDFIMKACLVLSDLNHVYKVNNFTNHNLAVMRKNWPEIKKAIRRTFLLINRFGIDRENLTSLNALLPIAYYLYRINTDLIEGSTEFHVLNAERVRRWLIASLLNRVFGGSSDSTIAASRATIAESLKSGRDFPLQLLHTNLSRQIKRPSTLSGEAIDSAMGIRYGQKLTFLILSLLYDDQSWGATPHQIDHIFPQSRLTRKALMGLNIPYSRVEGLLDYANRIGNLQLLSSRENVEKSNQSFEDSILDSESILSSTAPHSD